MLIEAIYRVRVKVLSNEEKFDDMMLRMSRFEKYRLIEFQKIRGGPYWNPFYILGCRFKSA